MNLPPTAPDARLQPFAVAAQRTLVVFGAPVELVFVPERQRRQGRATSDRPALARSRAATIVAEEALWRDERHAVTPNRYPFAAQQRILWPLAVQREPDRPMWQVAGAWADAAGGTALLNSVGAAATIARAHAHLLPERLGFLPALRTRPLREPPIDLPPATELVAADVPFCLLGVRGPAEGRAEALLRLGEARLTAAGNVVVQDGTAWLYPRRLETPAPHFPFALGAAEVWGRWCYGERAPFDAATAVDLERALVAAGAEPLP